METIILSDGSEVRGKIVTISFVGKSGFRLRSVSLLGEPC